MLSEMWPFLVVVALVTITPGPDTVLVVRTVLRQGRRDGLLAAFGCSCGLLLWGVACSLGLGLLAASTPFFLIVRFAGAAYLVLLGVRLIWTAWRFGTRALPMDIRTGPSRSAFWKGLLTDLLNPKAAVFFTALLPQFISIGEPMLLSTLLLASIAALAALTGLSAYACIAAAGFGVLRRDRPQRLLDMLTGGVFILLGGHLVMEP
jgi:threonine/homoserine/homoserine lactone efflux protein